MHLWDLTPSNTLSSPSKPGGKRELDDAPEEDEMVVDPMQASAPKVHHLSPLADTLVVAQKTETEITLGHAFLLGFHLALASSGRCYTMRFRLNCMGENNT